MVLTLVVGGLFAILIDYFTFVCENIAYFYLHLSLEVKRHLKQIIISHFTVDMLWQNNTYLIHNTKQLQLVKFICMYTEVVVLAAQ